MLGEENLKTLEWERVRQQQTNRSKREKMQVIDFRALLLNDQWHGDWLMTLLAEEES